MAGLNVGLISGLDTASLIGQLIQVEANPQTLLKNKLVDTRSDAKAYRAVNTKFDALRSAAEALTKAATWSAAKATSSSTSVTATASASASAGSLTFGVTQLAATHTIFSNGPAFDSATAAFGATSLTIADADGDTAPVGITLAADATLADAVAAINASNAGVTAAAVNTGSGYRLQVTSTASGLDGAFTLDSNFPVEADPTQTRGLVVATNGRDATLDLGGGVTATSSSNTFRDLMPGVSITVSTADGTPTTIAVSSDPESLTAAVAAMVTAANDVLSSIKGFTDSSGTSTTAVLKGDSSLRRLASSVLESVANAIGGTASASAAGIQLTREGKLTFTADTFAKTLQSDPALARKLVDGSPATTTNGVTTPAVPGVAQRLFTLATTATDSTTGTLTLLAKGQDTLATDLQKRIDDWDLRLATRRNTLERQFAAMESALGTLQNKSSWLSSQISSLPRWSSSSSS
ncbi:flagellar hook-associated protein 2 [Modestobacter sp. DSM 44400]|uniref:flagellar filament capping protein FliD n=1 Tax=Modestobacter sp. DSM 44400 TaxID=1550230 RepID=UPI00089517D6|nr:flagellar filament capping protein FliD [Modestobacter sp. DSM 44400]SDX87886.1 flagellar hook-associated protein 2 [Modestobacter sp. DSM 44400]